MLLICIAYVRIHRALHAIIDNDCLPVIALFFRHAHDIVIGRAPWLSASMGTSRCTLTSNMADPKVRAVL
jgi:hypothetical protein